MHLMANSTLATSPYRASSHSIPPHIEVTLRNMALCRDICITCAHNVYSRTLSSLEDNLKMVSKGRNMQLSSIAIKTSSLTQLCLTTYPFQAMLFSVRFVRTSFLVRESKGLSSCRRSCSSGIGNDAIYEAHCLPACNAV